MTGDDLAAENADLRERLTIAEAVNETLTRALYTASAILNSTGGNQ